jgi:hypothetical protein
MVGGEHERWEVPPRVDAEDELGWEGDDAGRPKRQHGQAPKVRARGFEQPSVCFSSTVLKLS